MIPSIHAQTYVNWDWEVNHGLPDSIDWTASTLDIAGNLYLVGNTVVTGQGPDVLTSKYDADGNLLWSQTYDFDQDRDYGAAVAVDVNGNVFVTGASFDADNFDYVTLMYDVNGTLQWASRYDGAGGDLDVPTAIQTDGSNQVFVTGMSAGIGLDMDYATVCYDYSGNQVWEKRYDYAGKDDRAAGLEIAPTGEVIVVGISADSTLVNEYAFLQYAASNGDQLLVERETLPGIALEKPAAIAQDNHGNFYLTGSIANGQHYDIYTAKLNDSLQLEWDALFDFENLDDEPNAIGVDPSGNVFVTGYASDAGGQQFVTLKYNSSGQEQWVNLELSDSTNGNAQATDLQITLDEQIYVTGSKAAGATEQVYTVCYDQTGEKLWEKLLEEPSEGGGIAVDLLGNVYVTGRSFAGNGYTYLALKYSTYFRSRHTVLNASNDPSHLKNEVLIGFAPSSLLKTRIDNPDLPYGKAADFVIPNVLTDMGDKLGLGTAIEDAVVIKIYPSLTSADTLSITRLGDTIRTLDFWTDLILVLPESQGESLTDEFEAADSLETLHPAIWFAHPNYLATPSGTANDSLYAGEQASLHPISPNLNADINIEPAWDIERGKEFVRVGVYDSGIDWKHEDFGGDGVSMSTSVIKGGKSYFTGTLTKDSPNNDSTGHGTAVAGIIGAVSNNTKGIAGIAGGDMNDPAAPQKGVSLYSMQVFEPNEAPVSDIAKAINDGASNAQGNGPAHHIMNFSFGTFSTDPFERFPVLRKSIFNAYKNQVVLIASRGNKGDEGNPKEYPACYPDNWVLNIGASGIDGEWKFKNQNGSKNYTSSFGNGLDFMAPGAWDIVRTLQNNSPSNQGYIPFSGSSAAAAHVSGVAGLMLSYMNQPTDDPRNLSHEDVEQILERTATDKGNPNYDQHSGWGLMDAGKALTMLEKPYYDILHLSGVPVLIDSVALNQTVTLLDDYVHSKASDVHIVNIFKYQAVIPYQPGNDSILGRWVRNSSSDGWGLDLALPIAPHDACVIDSFTANHVYVSGYAYEVVSSGTNQFWWPLNYSPHTAGNPQMAISIWIYNPTGTMGVSDNEISKSHPQLKVFPNPAYQAAYANLYFPTRSESSLLLTDIRGKVLWQKDQLLPQGIHEVVIPLDYFSAGLYFLSLSGKDFFLSQKLIKLN